MGQPKRKEKGSAAGPAAQLEPPATASWTPPERLSWRGWAVLGGVAFIVNLPLVHYFLLRPRAPVSASLPFVDDFSDPSTVERNYWSTGGLYRVVDGWLLSPGVRNNPLWLKASLPREVAIEFDVRSDSPEGDIKVEVFGDGYDHASGYVLIHGGWNNTVSVIARLDEHGPSLSRLKLEAHRKQPGASLVQAGVFRPDTRVRVEGHPFPVQRGKTYRWRVERRGSLLRWFIDGQPFLELDDPFPLQGPGHDRMGFSSWEAQLYFDNLKVTPL